VAAGQAADGDACQNRYGACGLRQAGGVAEEHDSCGRTGNSGGDLPEGEYTEQEHATPRT